MKIFEIKQVKIIIVSLLVLMLFADASMVYHILNRNIISALATNNSYLDGSRYGKKDSALFGGSSEKGWRKTVHIAPGGFPWQIEDDKISVGFEGGSWSGIYYEKKSYMSYSISVQAKKKKIGGISDYSKYGIYAYYVDGDNFVVGMIDAVNKVFASYQRINGKDGQWMNSLLDFADSEAENKISAIRINNEIRFYINDIQVQKRIIEGMREGFGGLIVEDMYVDYKEFRFEPADVFPQIKMPERQNGWGFASAGVPYGAGFDVKSNSEVVLNNISALWPSIWYGDELLLQYDYSVDVVELERDKNSKYAKYGIYAGFADNENYVAVFLDVKNGLFASYAITGGKPQAWKNTGVKFNPSNKNNIKVIRDGKLFIFYLNGVLMHTRIAQIGSAQVGLLTESTKAHYSNFSKNNFDSTSSEIFQYRNGWGPSSDGTAISKGIIVRSASSITMNTLGKVWNNIWLKNSKSTSFIYNFDATSLEVGSTLPYPKYGTYAAYVDSSNYFRVMLDPKYKVIASGGLKAGKEINWVNSPVDIDFKSPVKVKIIRNGNVFKVYINENLVQERSITLSAGDVGFVSEDCKAKFDNISYKQN